MNKSKTIAGMIFSALTLTTGTAGAAIVDPVTIDFEAMTFAAYYGKANLAPEPGGTCAGAGSAGCYFEDGFAIGTVSNPDPNAHLHRYDGDFSTLLQYHPDSPGIYVRAQDSSAFSLTSMEFQAPIKNANPGTGPNDVWEILGFNTALNPDLAAGDGTNYPTVVAYQTVANGFNGTLTLDEAFENIDAFWIHYKGYPIVPEDGKRFDLRIDNITLSAPVSAVPIPAAVWLFGTGLMGLVSLGRRKAGLAVA
ncbi:VPLPA-CTERM sorting domain-containing protein [Methylocaldum gracile subsp. desertum]|jgi:hypothetical protein|uniref:VPLPA-CTERM sorting domain-containing protein n=1 Tax=unclassified Methylocaldum TaxID=2622260 RepID=UPI003DA0FAEA